MNRDQFVGVLRTLGACSDPGDAVPWAESLPAETTAAEAWVLCSRGDWLVWLLGELHVHGLLTRITLVLAACAAARTALGGAIFAIETAEAWARGEASIDDVNSAADAAYAAYSERAAAAYSDAYSAAACYSAVAAAAAYSDADAADSATDSGSAAAESAYYAWSDRAAAESMRSKRHAEIADAVRAAVPWATVEAAVACMKEVGDS